jgi:hypothetical protein
MPANKAIPARTIAAVTHPNLDLRISASLQHVDLNREDIDVA